MKCIVPRMSTLAVSNHNGEHPIHLACQYQTLGIVRSLYEQYDVYLEQLYLKV